MAKTLHHNKLDQSPTWSSFKVKNLPPKSRLLTELKAKEARAECRHAMRGDYED